MIQMTEMTEKMLSRLRGILDEERLLDHAACVMQFDMETLCPPEGRKDAGDTIAYLTNRMFRLRREPAFREAADLLYEHSGELSEFDRALVGSLHLDYLRTKNITPEQDLEFSKIINRAYDDWIRAKEASDYSLFAPSLSAVRDTELKKISLMEEKLPVPYDNLLDLYERGITSEVLDDVFGRCRSRLVPLLRKITSSGKKIRTDFLTRRVEDEAQREIAEYLLRTIGFDFSRGALTTTEHPFTESMGPDDERVTTHFYPNLFTSSMYSIIHEGGHGLFDQNQPRESWTHHIDDLKTMGQHESVSRFYENVIGRSEAFIHLIWPKTQEVFSDVLGDVTEREFYEAVNVVSPSLIRTEADEFTYTFHIIIRYELEKAIVNDGISVDDLPRLWNDAYESCLGIRPDSDRGGILQDVHWSSGFGYFPAYALGNMYNAMYTSRMRREFDLDTAVSEGRFDVINGWMKENVWKKADLLAPREWIRDITGRDLTPDDFLEYLEEKYSAIYGL